MSPLAGAITLVRRRPALLAAWVVLLALPTLLGFLPLSGALRPYLDLRPAASALISVPTDDGLLIELVERAPELTTLGVSSLFVTFAIGVPLLWLLAGWVASTALGSSHPAGLVAARTVGIEIIALPLRALPWMAALAIGWGGMGAQTFERLLGFVVPAIVAYLVLSTLVTTVVDFARGVALDEPSLGWWRTLGRGWSTARAQRGTFLSLCVLDLVSMSLAVLPIALSRPLAIVQGGVLASSIVTLFLRACASVVGIAAAATAAASRSA
jgi:hypothetical protein